MRKDTSKILPLAMTLAIYSGSMALAQDLSTSTGSTESRQAVTDQQQPELFVNSETGQIVHITSDGQVIPATTEELQALLPINDQEAAPSSSAQPLRGGGGRGGSGHGGGYHGGWHGGYRGGYRGGWGWRGGGYYPYYPYYPYCGIYITGYNCWIP